MQFFIETKNNIEEKMHRRLTYYKMYIYADIIGEFSEEKTKGCVKKSKMYVFWDKRKLFRAENIWDDDKMESKTSYNGNCSLHDIRKCTPQFADGDYYRCNYYDAIKSCIFFMAIN